MSDEERTKWIITHHSEKIKFAEDFFLVMWNKRPPNVRYDDIWTMFEKMLEREPYSELNAEEKLVVTLVHRLGFLFLRKRLQEELG